MFVIHTVMSSFVWGRLQWSSENSTTNPTYVRGLGKIRTKYLKAPCQTQKRDGVKFIGVAD